MPPRSSKIPVSKSDSELSIAATASSDESSPRRSSRFLKNITTPTPASPVPTSSASGPSASPTRIPSVLHPKNTISSTPLRPSASAPSTTTRSQAEVQPPPTLGPSLSHVSTAAPLHPQDFPSSPAVVQAVATAVPLHPQDLPSSPAVVPAVAPDGIAPQGHSEPVNTADVTLPAKDDQGVARFLEYPRGVLYKALWDVGQCVIGVFNPAFWRFQLPIPVVLIAVLLPPILSIAIGPFLPSPCNLPYLSEYPFCKQKVQKAVIQWPDFHKLCKTQVDSFEPLLRNSTHGSRLAYRIRRAAMATNDLTTLVSASNLTSRDAIVSALDSFANNAERASQALYRFDARLNSAVDFVVSSNEIAYTSIERLLASASPSALSPAALSSQRTIWPFPSSTPRAEHAIALQIYQESLAASSTHVTDLIFGLQPSRDDLDRLALSLNEVYRIGQLDNALMKAAQDQLLGQIWTQLGGNKGRKKHFEDHFELLHQVESYRERGLNYVSIVQHHLNALAAELEQLRKGMNAPQLVGDAVPLGVQQQSISMAISRLRIATEHMQLPRDQDLLLSIDAPTN